jgi:NADPH-dependent 2,4-dienoyl-CoA reductase/sulfur reductase-like enzyme/nitrite reductase/ring-hydroxylating ferredoxin subunit
MSDQATPSGPDFSSGVPLSSIADGSTVAGHVGDKAVLVTRRGGEIFAIGGTCTHYSGPLGEGLFAGDTVRCPWHHACFSLRTGEALRAPALNPVARWRVQQRDGRVTLVEEMDPGDPIDAQCQHPGGTPPASVVIVGAGAAGNAAAEMLRRLDYRGAITMIGPEDTVPYDRPNLSKDYLAGTASADWIPLRPREFYEQHRITLMLGRRAIGLDTGARRVHLDDGSDVPYGALLLATGAEPTQLPPAFDRTRLYYLRSLADSNAIIQAANGAKRAVVIGASFIGLEVAASLRARGLEVDIVAPEARPLERILGPQLGDLVRSVHESHGVHFHLGQTAETIKGGAVTLKNGERLEADLIVAGIGVRPRDALALQAGLTIDRGVRVNEYLQTSASGVFAAGDIARYPDPRTGDRIRVEHWVVAERQGQAAARNMMGLREAFVDVPFFWSQHYDMAISYVGHAEQWDEIRVDGNVEQKDCTATFVRGGKTLAVVTVGRDRASLGAELGMERERPGQPGTSGQR